MFENWLFFKSQIVQSLSFILADFLRVLSFLLFNWPFVKEEVGGHSQ